MHLLKHLTKYDWLILLLNIKQRQKLKYLTESFVQPLQNRTEDRTKLDWSTWEARTAYCWARIAEIDQVQLVS